MRGAYKFDRLIMVPKKLERISTSSLIQYDTIEEALANVEGTKVFLEPKGEHSFDDIPEGDIVFIMGNASRSNARYVTENDLSVRIDTPGSSDLFAVNALAIALDRRING